MSDVSEKYGKCLCGAVSITAKAASNHVGACHCRMCRRWSGGPYVEINCGTEVSFAGQENISVFSSSDWAERGFCAKCGTHLFYRIKETKEHMMPVGLFECDEGTLAFTTQVFVDEKPSYYSFANETQNMTGPEIFAMFSSSD
ncbi:MAG: GFA family protein [Rhodospirillaceae bacterium]